MRFSLTFVLALLTISCFAVWVYQLSERRARILESNASLAVELAAFDSNLERDVQFLRLADRHRDQAVDDIMGKLETYVTQKAESQKLAEDFHSDELTIRQIILLQEESHLERAPLEFQIYVPKGVRANWIIKPHNTLSEAHNNSLLNKVLTFTKPIEIELPVGLSTMIITSEHRRKRYSDFKFLLNGQEVAAVRAVPPIDPNPDYHYSNGLIFPVVPYGRDATNLSGSKRLLIAESTYKDWRENYDEVRAEIGFHCIVEIDRVPSKEPQQ